MNKKSLSKLSAEFTQLSNKFKIKLPKKFKKFKTKKESNQLFSTLLEQITNKKQTQKQENNMATLKELVTMYNSLVTNNQGLGDFKVVKSFRTKTAAQEAIEELEDMIEAAVPPAKDEVKEEAKPKKSAKADKTKEEKMAKPKKDKKTDAPVIKVNRLQHIILNLLVKDEELPMGKVKKAYMKSQDKDKATIVPATIGKLVKMGLLEKEGAEVKDDALVILTDLGKQAAAQPEPEVAPVPEKKPKYTPLHTEDDIKGMKKKKGKKARKAQDDHMAAWVSENGEITKRSITRTPSNYKGGIKQGKHQKDDCKENPTERLACMDLWEEVVTDKFLITRSEFIKLGSEKHDMKTSTPASIWSHMYKLHGFTADQVKSIQDGVPVDGSETEEKPAKKDKKSKKDKKAKK